MKQPQQEQIQKKWLFGWPRKSVKFIKWTIYHISWNRNWWNNLQLLACSSHNNDRHWNLINLRLWTDRTESWTEPPHCWLLAFFLLSFFLMIYHLNFTQYVLPSLAPPISPPPPSSSSTSNSLYFFEISFSFCGNKHTHTHTHKMWMFSLLLFDSIRIWSDFICLLMFRIKYVACERDEMRVRARQYCTWKSNDLCICECEYKESCYIFIWMFCT